MFVDIHLTGKLLYKFHSLSRALARVLLFLLWSREWASRKVYLSRGFQQCIEDFHFVVVVDRELFQLSWTKIRLLLKKKDLGDPCFIVARKSKSYPGPLCVLISCVVLARVKGRKRLVIFLLLLGLNKRKTDEMHIKKRRAPKVVWWCASIITPHDRTLSGKKRRKEERTNVGTSHDGRAGSSSDPLPLEQPGCAAFCLLCFILIPLARIPDYPGDFLL